MIAGADFRGGGAVFATARFVPDGRLDESFGEGDRVLNGWAQVMRPHGWSRSRLQAARSSNRPSSHEDLNDHHAAMRRMKAPARGSVRPLRHDVPLGGRAGRKTQQWHGARRHGVLELDEARRVEKNPSRAPKKPPPRLSY